MTDTSWYSWNISSNWGKLLDANMALNLNMNRAQLKPISPMQCITNKLIQVQGKSSLAFLIFMLA